MVRDAIIGITTAFAHRGYAVSDLTWTRR